MYNMRIVYQEFAFALCVAIMTVAVLSAFQNRRKIYSDVIWFFWGLIGVLFYVDVLFIDYLPGNNSDLSAIRTLAQYTLISVRLFLWMLRDWRKSR